MRSACGERGSRPTKDARKQAAADPPSETPPEGDHEPRLPTVPLIPLDVDRSCLAPTRTAPPEAGARRRLMAPRTGQPRPCGRRTSTLSLPLRATNERVRQRLADARLRRSATETNGLRDAPARFRFEPAEQEPTSGSRSGSRLAGRSQTALLLCDKTTRHVDALAAAQRDRCRTALVALAAATDDADEPRGFLATGCHR